MTIRSVRLQLTILYAGTVALILVLFIGADMLGLRHNLMQQVADGALSRHAMQEAWTRAMVEHVLLAAGLVAVVFVVGWVFIRRTLRPVREMTRTARAITSENLSSRVDARGDRAEIGELADTLNDMIARLESSFDRTRRFSADAAHELSTPLTTLRGELEIALRRERDGEAYRETLRGLLAQVDRISGVVDQLLFLSRLDEGRGLGEGETASLDDIVVATWEGLREQASGRGLDLALGDVDEVRVRGSAEMLGLLIENLIANAIEFTDPPGKIAIRLASTGEDFELTVEDEGVGIPAGDLPRVFDRFFRVDESRARTRGGVGLGLSIVREVADAHGFDVHLDSTPGEGTTVVVTGARAL